MIFLGTPFDISSDFHDSGLARLSLGGSGALSGHSANGLASGRSSGSGSGSGSGAYGNSSSQGLHSPSKNSSRANSSNNSKCRIFVSFVFQLFFCLLVLLFPPLYILVSVTNSYTHLISQQARLRMHYVPPGHLQAPSGTVLLVHWLTD